MTESEIKILNYKKEVEALLKRDTSCKWNLSWLQVAPDSFLNAEASNEKGDLCTFIFQVVEDQPIVKAGHLHDERAVARPDIFEISFVGNLYEDPTDVAVGPNIFGKKFLYDCLMKSETVHHFFHMVSDEEEAFLKKGTSYNWEEFDPDSVNIQ